LGDGGLLGVAAAVYGAADAGLLSRPTFGATNCAIKGNISPSGERIYNVSSLKYYQATIINRWKGERWFCSEADARRAGWRKARI
jgi:micrococcal nuclease